MIMLKLIEAKRFGDRNTINIEGTAKSSKSGSREGKGEELPCAIDSLNKYILNVFSKRLRVK